MPAILDDDENTLAPNSGERPIAVLSPRELALQAIEEGRVREFEQESGVKVPPQPAIDEDMDSDDVAAEQERARLEVVADGTALRRHRAHRRRRRARSSARCARPSRP